MLLSPVRPKMLICALTLAVGHACISNVSSAWAQQNASVNHQARRSSLPDEALQQARQAEQHLAADQPDQAIAILRDLDKKHPGTAAISLRLAQIYDTLNRNGHALFYYRRYIERAGPQARVIAVERVATLELMLGIDDDAEAAAQEIGETTRPVATPAPQVKRMLATEAKDGTLVPINSEEDLLRYQKQGVPESAPGPRRTTSTQAIIIPPELTVTPRSGTLATTPATDASTAESAATAAHSPAPKSRAAVYSDATPRPPDEDALLANAFRKADAAVQVPESIEQQKAETLEKLKKTEASQEPAVSRPTPQITPKAKAATAKPATTPAATPPTQPQVIAYTQATPAFESTRAASFFNVSQGNSPKASIVIMNELGSAVVTVSVIPEDDAEAASAILMPGENKTLLVDPARYDVTAKAVTTDYSPITIMSAQFNYTFHGNRQYTHRFNETSLQQMN